MKLRPYQTEALHNLRKSLSTGRTRPILVLPTGSGKTMIASEIVRLAEEKGKRVLFFAPRRELIFQAQNAFAARGIEAGIIMADEPQRVYAKMQIASFDTIHSRAMRTEKMKLPSCDIVIVDEAHLSLSETRTKILNEYSDKIIIGLTATPARGDGRGLGAIYDDLVCFTTIRELTPEYLVPLRYFAPVELDLSKVKQTKSDYRENSLGDYMDDPKLIGAILENWLRIAPTKSTVVFCTNRAHSRHVCSEFVAAGITAEHVDGETDTDERAAILKRVDSGETQVLCNVYVATYGLDIPRLECAVLARPTKNITLYLQTVGRIMRPFENKESAIVIDHAGAVKQHGFVDEDIPWTLEDSDIREAREKQKKEKKEPKEITCSECKTVFSGRRDCPSCGHAMIPPSKDIPCHAAELEEVWTGRDANRINRNATAEEKEAFVGGLKAICARKGYAKGWISNQYRSKFGVWPNAYQHAPMVEPNQDVLNWIKYQTIKWKNRRRA